MLCVEAITVVSTPSLPLDLTAFTSPGPDGWLIRIYRLYGDLSALPQPFPPLALAACATLSKSL